MTATKNRRCSGKKAHPSAAQAQRHRARLIRAGAAPGALEVYQCSCGNWHVGHRLRAKAARR